MGNNVRIGVVGASAVWVPALTGMTISRDLPAQLILDMRAHDVVEFVFHLESQLARTCAVDAFGPIGDDTGDQGVRFAADARGDLVAGDAAQRVDLFADRAGD